MKFIKILLLAMTTLLSTTLSAQPGEARTRWSAEVVDLGEGLYRIDVTAKIPSDLHIYAMGELGGYNPTTLSFGSENVTLSTAWRTMPSAWKRTRWEKWPVLPNEAVLTLP